jgi:predicted alpha/beta superfamily hydrolase
MTRVRRRPREVRVRRAAVRRCATLAGFLSLLTVGAPGGHGFPGVAVAQGSPMLQFIVVEVPEGTPADAPVWISGDLPVLGSWNGAGERLERVAGGRCVLRVELERGAAFEFKVTRGSWETVEKDARGGEIANRRARAGERDTLFVTVAAWRDQAGGEPLRRSTLTGEVRRHAAFPSRFVRSRDVLVWLPPGYAADTTQRYPVLYFHDGNNVFDSATSFKGTEWGADETAGRLIRAGALRPCILVGIDNTPDRLAEYTPVPDARHGGGRAAGYERFLAEELKPFVDRSYRTLQDPSATGLVGSSLGALVSLDLALQRPDLFGLVGCVSPAAWWAERDIVGRAASVGKGTALRIWLDIGTAEGTEKAGTKEWLDDARALRAALVTRGWREGANLHYEEVEGAVHDEGAWAARLDRILIFLLGPPRR